MIVKLGRLNLLMMCPDNEFYYMTCHYLQTCCSELDSNLQIGTILEVTAVTYSLELESTQVGLS